MTRSVYDFAAMFLAVSLLAGCAPGNERFIADTPAGFFWGIWHGCISFFTLVVGIWNPAVEVYEPNNTGGWYNAGFLLGVAMAWGGGGRTSEASWRKRGRDAEARRRNEQEWSEVAHKVEAKIKRRLSQWAEAEPDEDWQAVEARIEQKVKEVVRDWAEKE